jgi:hypothetical protein
VVGLVPGILAETIPSGEYEVKERIPNFVITCIQYYESLEYSGNLLVLFESLEETMANVVQSPYTDQILENLQYQGRSNDCAPYTTATVVNTFRAKNLIGDELAKQMNKPQMRGVFLVIRRVPNWATFPWGIVDVLRENNFKARWWFRVPVSYLRPAIANGHILMPIVGEWRPKPWAHVKTLVAWDPQKGWGFADTQTSRKQISWHSDEGFQRKWKNYGRLLVEIEKP